MLGAMGPNKALEKAKSMLKTFIKVQESRNEQVRIRIRDMDINETAAR